jgi:hypothetical protein
MRYLMKLNNKEANGGYSGAQMGSGRNSGEQERESWKDSGAKSAFEGPAADNQKRNDSDGNSNVGDSNEFNTRTSREGATRPINDLGQQLDNSL